MSTTRDFAHEPVMRDEIVALFADAQVGAETRFDARLRFLIGRPVEPPFFAAASVVARVAAMRPHVMLFMAETPVGPVDSYFV